MKVTKEGLSEREVVGKIEGLASSFGAGISFPTILSQNGQILHNHKHDEVLTNGRLLLVDAGAETQRGYCSDNTRTFPVSGTFTEKQKAVYNICLEANMKAIEEIRVGVKYRDIHFIAVKIILDGLKTLGILKGDVSEALKEGVHTLFMPHGLGHMLGLDVHDMEDYGEDFVGYNETTKRSTDFGTAYIRLARELQEGFVLTVEPGIYFIPELINKFKEKGKFMAYVNYDLLESDYLDFGGIRIEDDVVVTKNGCRVLGQGIPKSVEEIEEMMQNKAT
ncbi:MAG: Xaa-Pro aminopeptidase (EC [uncultured Sulfurovum sp.]|uniref:Xaa-Pro aminopeptidase n=1 Tax=uncultured Sulfurovum sp. TaxID=269237 RepID=A0A6S6TSH8_9BACT|nr:MAG: Xaa-Pro aminopeptidase (EC [uncultured Sulfurovum sp.]